MRITVAALMSFLVPALLNAQGGGHVGLEPEVYAINQSAPHSAPVAFSIRYPKGWTKWENTTVGSDNLGDLASPRDDELVCRLETPLNQPLPSDPRTIITVTNYACITIFRGHGGTAKEEAEDFARRIGNELRSLGPVKTIAGDTGYLLMCSDDIALGHRLRSDLFFHVGRKGHIRISIVVMGTFLGMRESLQNLILGSLQFPRANESLQPTTR